MKLLTMLLASGAAAIGIAVGWFAHERHVNEPCKFMAQAYTQVRVDISSLPNFPLARVPKAALAAVQRCWASKPYGGPQHALELVEAFGTRSKDYYLAFEPVGLTDVQVIFLIRGDDEKPLAAFQRSTN